MYQILKKLLIVFLCLCLLSSFAFAADDLLIVDPDNFDTFGHSSLSDYGVSTISDGEYAVTVNSYWSNGTDTLGNAQFAMSSSKPSITLSRDYEVVGLKFPSYNPLLATIPAGTLVGN